MPPPYRLPLLTDHHTHPLLYSCLYDAPDLRNVKDKPDALASIARGFADGHRALLPVLGWIDSRYGFSEAELEQFPPLVILNASLHSALLNHAAKTLLRDQYGLAFESGNLLTEGEVFQIYRLVVALNASCQRLQTFFSWLLAQGVAAAQDMWVSEEAALSLYDEANLGERVALWASPDLYESSDAGRRAQIYGVKLFADGAIGSCTAAFHERYSTGAEGILTYGEGELEAVLERCGSFQRPVAIHAIGDRALDQIVSFFDRSPRCRERFPEIRLEHAQFLTRETALTAKKLGLRLSMQPNFSTDSVTYRDRLSPRCCASNNPFRMLIDEAGFFPGDDLILGSDGMPHGAAAALASALNPPHAGQKLTLPEFAAGYCCSDYRLGYIELETDDGKCAPRIVLTNPGS